MAVTPANFLFQLKERGEINIEARNTLFFKYKSLVLLLLLFRRTEKSVLTLHLPYLRAETALHGPTEQQQLPHSESH